jgi:hypothetical protein
MPENGHKAAARARLQAVFPMLEQRDGEIQSETPSRLGRLLGVRQPSAYQRCLAAHIMAASRSSKLS